MMHKTIAVAALAMLLAACDGGAESGADGGTAEGEVLGGTISDEMLPLDTVRSQSPPLRTEPDGGAAGEEAAEETDEAPDAEAAGEGDETTNAGSDADGPPQIQLNPAPEPEPAANESDGD